MDSSRRRRGPPEPFFSTSRRPPPPYPSSSRNRPLPAEAPPSVLAISPRVDVLLSHSHRVPFSPIKVDQLSAARRKRKRKRERYPPLPEIARDRFHFSRVTDVHR
ncbi:hypothetical protein PUN28_004227 [Cardiocondyla obscurior]|uniref:Uncharacterized protein n=1 Tax=Cardiocondyla obscurior TaxID=286306 RepID=A0AAW2GQ68_9HYME